MFLKIRCSDLHLVNAAYTSQCDSIFHNLLVGERKGDQFYCESGDVIQADYNAARNVLAACKNGLIVISSYILNLVEALTENE